MSQRIWFVLVIGCAALSCGDEGPEVPEAPFSRTECIRRAVFPEPTSSPYCLPFAEGSAFTLTQSYCSPSGRSHNTRFAWDFAGPMGTEIIAARAGVVVELREHWLDTDPQGGHENMVAVRHDDESLSLYIHMMKDGVLVELGDTVPRGGLIGWMGSSGTGFSHLHFMICLRAGLCSSPTEITLPISYRNAVGPLDSIGGMVEGEEYLAGACSTLP